MKVSLVMPTINVTTELDLFLKSLKAQTYKDFELIVVDQNEGNEVFEIVKDYEEDFKIKYVKSDEKGLSLNRNRGLILMKGEIVGFPDDDCEYSPDKLEKVVAFF
ncbi:glycosyltransferase family A protein [Leptotrichia massiliensis]